MQGRDNIAGDSCSASTLKALDSELIGIVPGAVLLLPLATSSHAVTDDDCDALLSLHCFQSDNARAIANLATK